MEGALQGSETGVPAVTERGNGAIRGADGRFLPGNPGGPGNPRAARVAELRRAFLEGITEDDLREIVAGLTEKAKRGEISAVTVLFDRLFGKVDCSYFPDVAEPISDELTKVRETRAALEAERERLKDERKVIETRWRALQDRLSVEQKKAALTAAVQAMERGKPIPAEALAALTERHPFFE
jgi:predicted nuclease with TOPRIM domain